jgi:preprotein translocase subunit SecG
MISFLFGFQIFITILISLIIVFQKSSSDGIVVSNNGGQIPSNAQHSFISKFTIFLIFIFMANSLILARNSISQNKEGSAIIKSLENENISKDVIVSDDNVPKME